MTKIRSQLQRTKRNSQYVYEHIVWYVLLPSPVYLSDIFLSILYCGKPRTVKSRSPQSGAKFGLITRLLQPATLPSFLPSFLPLDPPLTSHLCSSSSAVEQGAWIGSLSLSLHCVIVSSSRIYISAAASRSPVDSRTLKGVVDENG
jgi:hypothetical protein